MSDPEKNFSGSAETQAETALELLRSLARAGEDPEQFAQACRDWSRLSNQVETLPEFQSVLSMLTASPDDNGPPPPIAPRLEPDPKDTFTLDADGKISSLTQEVASQFDLKIGDILHPSVSSHLAQEQSMIGFLVECEDRSGIARQIKVYPKAEDGQLVGYTGQAFLYRLSTSMRQHLADHFALTISEIEILELVLRRHRLEQIADMRGIKLNTVRTHIARINGKLSCHSLLETISKTVELSDALDVRAEPLHVLPSKDENAARVITLSSEDQKVEYRRYGNASGQPVIVLHSLEYGYLPSQEMIAAARAQGVNLIFPLRPGFGATSPADSVSDAAKLMSEFLRILDLKNVILIGLSTSAPLALELQTMSSRISKTALVNYGLDVEDKLSAIQPKWLSGLLRMSLSSNASFAFGIRSLHSMTRTFGRMRFYRMMYRNQDSDLEYLEENTRAFEIMADYLYGADLTNTRLDIETAFMANPRATALLSKVDPLIVINGADQHGVGPEASRAAAARHKLDFRQADHPGRNWMFRHPNALFRHIMPGRVEKHA